MGTVGLTLFTVYAHRNSKTDVMRSQLCSQRKSWERRRDRNVFPTLKAFLKAIMRTIGRNGKFSRRFKGFRHFCSCVPTLPYTLKSIDIEGKCRVKRPYTRVRGFYVTENRYGRSWGEWTKRTAGSKGVPAFDALSIKYILLPGAGALLSMKGCICGV